MLRTDKANTKKQTIARLSLFASLVTANVPNEGFRMDRYVTKYDAKHGCGFICCLVGWLPAIFPKFFRWSQVGSGWIAKLRNFPTFDPKGQVMRFFGISSELFDHLFAGTELRNEEGRIILAAVPDMRTITRDQAVARMNKAIRLMELGKIRA